MWKPTDPQLFFSRNDPDDPRLGDHVQALADLGSLNAILGESVNPSRTFVIGGYPDDDGIRLNGGRPGASKAPPIIRRALYKMTPALQHVQPFQIFDLGDLNVASDSPKNSLEARHASGASACTSVLTGGARWIGLGGGHDYGFSEARGFLDWAKTQTTSEKLRPLVINFDAHFDVRPTEKGFSSGTPFYRMLESGSALDFAELGIQGQCNSRKHFKYLEERGARVLTMEDVESSGQSFETCAAALLDDWILKPRPTYVSIDIDAFSSVAAPGCSQSWATGFLPNEFFPLFDLLVRRLDVRALGIYETSPPLDQDDRTSKLAALIAHRFIARAGLS